MTTDLTSGLDTAAFSSVIKPSDDLFRFVNGPWIDTYRLPDDKARYGSFDKLAEDAESQIRDILEDEDCPAAKSQALYRSFMDTDAIEAAGATPIRPALDAIDHASDKAALTRAIGALKPIDMGPDVFDIAVFGDPKNPDTNVVHLEQSGIGLPDEAYYREDHYAPIREAYVDMVAKQLRLAGYGDEETTRAQADRFLDVETRIAANHWDNVATRDSQKTYNPTDFATLSDELAHFDIAAWADAWQGAYDATPAAKTQPVDLTAALQHTIVHEPSFLKGFDAFWNNADLDDLKLWARVHVIIGTASLLSHDYDAANFDFYGKVLSGTTQQRDRWRRGVSLVNGVCGEDVGREYVKRHFPESSKQRMGQLVDNLIDAYRVSITNSDWLGEETKAKALEKLSKFTPMIGYTERWRDYTAFDVHADAGLVANMQAAALYEWGFQLSKAGKPVDKGEWLMNPQTVNAYYEPSMNVIVFPAAILQPPFFNPDAEDAANYGGIGAVIAYKACIAGAAGGCQAEIGSASAMAAGALVTLRGGTAEQVCHAVAMALKNLLGLVCDPVAGLVEVPCVKRNVIGAMNAMAAADMALAGIESRIPVDEVIDAIGDVGRRLPVEFRETALGGLAVTPTGKAVKERMMGNRNKNRTLTIKDARWKLQRTGRSS